jgi:hypothetical protein
MASLKNEVREFLRVYFSNIRLESPLFFKSQYGVRFDLQVGEVGTEEYFKECVFRAKEIFEYSFDENDNVIFYLTDYRWKKRKLRFANYCFRTIADLSKDEIEYHTLKNRYGTSDISNVALIKIIRNRISHTDIFQAVANKDFSRTPALDQTGFLSNKEVYLINLDKRIIFYMYDDRGLDIITNSKDALTPIYDKFKNWILESNRDKIDEIFS